MKLLDKLTTFKYLHSEIKYHGVRYDYKRKRDHHEVRATNCRKIYPYVILSSRKTSHFRVYLARVDVSSRGL